MLISKTFYAFQNTRIPATITVLTVALNVFFCYFFIWLLSFTNYLQTFIITLLDLQSIPQNSVIGLPLALAISGIFQLALLLIMLYVKIDNFKIKGIRSFIIKIGAASMLLGLVSYFVRQYVGGVVDMQTFWGIFVQAALASIIGAVVYLSSVFLLRYEN